MDFVDFVTELVNAILAFLEPLGALADQWSVLYGVIMGIFG